MPINNFPDIGQGTPTHEIIQRINETFLCITPQMLSKIRKNISFGAQK